MFLLRTIVDGLNFPLLLYQVKYRSVDPEGRYPSGHEQYSYCFALQRAEVEERRTIVRLVLILNLTLLIFQM